MREPSVRVEHGLLLISYGESELCDAQHCRSSGEIHAAVNQLVFLGDASPVNQEELQGICDYITDDENWSSEGVMQPFDFEIGTICGYRLNGLIATPPPSPQAKQGEK